MEAVEAKALLSHARVVRRVDRAAESARVAEAGVVDEHDQDVRGILRGLHLRRLVPVWLGALERLLGEAAYRGAPNRQEGAVSSQVAHPPVPPWCLADRDRGHGTNRSQ